MRRKETEIIKVLLENSEDDFNIRKISKYSKIDYKNVYIMVRRLEKAGIIETKKFGKSIKCTLIKKPNPLIFKTEYERRAELLKNKNFLVIYKKLNSLRFPLIALLFGSYVKGRATKHSDIDILVLCEKKQKEKIQNIFDLFPLDTHLTSITFEDFMIMVKSKEFSVVSEALKKNIVLLGIEDYYRMIENVE